MYAKTNQPHRVNRVRTGKVAAVAIATICATGLIGGCSTGGSATAENVDVGRTTSDPKAEPDLLDTGANTTIPATPYGDAADDTALAALEAQRIAEYTIMPTDFDSSYFGRVRPTQIVPDAETFGEEWATAATVPAMDDFVSGFASSGRQYETDGESSQLYVLRFTDADNATEAAHQISDTYITEGSYGLKPVALRIPTMPDGIGYRVENKGLKTNTVGVFVAHDEYLFIATVFGKSGMDKEIFGRLRTAVDAQKALIDQYDGDSESTAIDPDKILIYALPPAPKKDADGKVIENQNPDPGGVYGPKGYAHFMNRSDTVLGYLEDAGVDRVATRGSVVYRAADDGKAENLLDGALVSIAKNDAAQDTESPVGLENAECVQGIDGVTPTFTCWVRVGRYIGEVTGTDPVDVHQRISAQYLILTHADQDA